MNFFGFQFIIGNSSVTATKKIQNILSSSVIAGGIYGEHLSQNRMIDRKPMLLKLTALFYTRLATFKHKKKDNLK